MEQTKYRIGDAANMMGISRDTLRYYEKRGILNTEKSENGYRYYTDQDISRMVSILYQRKMNLGLQDIEALWSGNCDIRDFSQLLQNQLTEEEEAIRAHQQAIARLRLTMSECTTISSRLDQVSLGSIPPSYIIHSQATMEESISQWFRYSNLYPGLDMMYLYDEYAWQTAHAPENGKATDSQKSGQLQADSQPLLLEYKNTSLLLSKEVKPYVDYPLSTSTDSTDSALCVSTFCASPTRIPSTDSIMPMLEWAEKRKLKVSSRLYSTFALQGMHEGQPSYFLKLYIPVSPYDAC